LKKIYNENLLVFKTIYTQNLLRFKKYFYLKITYIEKSFQTSKKKKSQKNGIRSFDIYVQYLYTKGNYKKVAQKL